MAKVYLGIGSNLGDRKANCLEAISLLKEIGVSVIKKSSMYETEPWGVKEQPRFINMAVKCETNLSPRGVLELLKKIENEMGRKETVLYGPRIIDLDILLYDALVLDEPGLKIPHRLLHERKFVLEPLSEIAPEVLHPVSGKTIKELFSAIDG